MHRTKKLYDAFVDRFIELYESGDASVPIFVNYGTNRSVLDIPLRIRKKHQFSKWTALERCIENELDYRIFFEWFRNQEDYEAELIREKQDFSYKDVSLQCVRRAVQAMLPEFTGLQVKRNPLRLVVTKNGIQHPKRRYSELGSTEQGRAVRNRLREHLVQQQKSICCYCCRSLKAGALDAHNEHIRPQSSYPNDSMDYGNLLASCNDGNTCGTAKKDFYDPRLFVSPLQDDCEEHFVYLEDGRIKGVTEQGRYTVDILNLNQWALVNQRKTLFNDCLQTAQYAGKDQVREWYLQEIDGVLPKCVDMVSYFYRKGVFNQDVCGSRA